MSDSPIFDALNSEQDYTGKMESTRKLTSRLFPTAMFVYRSEQNNQPDPHLDGSYVEEEEEVLVRPFMPVQGIPRGTLGQMSIKKGIPSRLTSEEGLTARVMKAPTHLSEQDLLDHGIVVAETFSAEAPEDPHGCTDACRNEHGIRGLLEHVGIDTSNGISVGDRVVAEPRNRTFMEAMREASEAPPVELTAKVPEASAKLVEDLLEGHGLINSERLAENFHPLDLEKQGISFTEFALMMVRKFREKYPHIKNVKFSTVNELDGTETFVVESTDPRPEPGVIYPKEVEQWVKLPEGTEALGSILRDVRKTFNEQHPGYVMTAVNGIQEHDDGSATLRLEAQKLEPVKPLPEKDTAQLME